MKTLAAWLRRPFGAALAAFLALRLLTSGLAALTAALTPVWITVEAPHDPTLLAQLEEGSPALRLLAAPWYRWDTVNYIEIAQNGYANPQNTIWPPLYPLLIRGGLALGLHPLAAALLVSNAAALGFFWLLYRLAEREWDAALARHTLLAVVIFPTAFFLVAGYSESLFCYLPSPVSARHGRGAGCWRACWVRRQRGPATRDYFWPYRWSGKGCEPGRKLAANCRSGWAGWRCPDWRCWVTGFISILGWARTGRGKRSARGGINTWGGRGKG